MKIVFFGTPDFAVASLKALVDAGHNVTAVVTMPDKEMGRGKKIQESAVKTYASSQGLQILQPIKLKSKTFIQKLKEIDADIHIVVAFRMLPEVVWNMPRLGTINVHGSLLPQYRGAAPINWAIMNGEKETGVSTFRLKHEIDTGDILMQSKMPISDIDNFGTMYDKLKVEGAKLLLKTLYELKNDSITPIAQADNTDFAHAPKLTKELCLINWDNNVVKIHNLIRGLSPIPCAYTYLNGKSLKIFASHYELDNNIKEIGSYKTDNKSMLSFAAKDGWLYCDEVQLEGKKRMTIVDFLRGYRFI